MPVRVRPTGRIDVPVIMPLSVVMGRQVRSVARIGSRPGVRAARNLVVVMDNTVQATRVIRVGRFVALACMAAIVVIVSRGGG